jgi:radical SAM protein with 4Fe4S-binding SPASM domain
MTKELFVRILERIDHLKKSMTLELHGIGEPLLHPQIYEFTAESVKRGFYPSICTNAILLNKTAAKRLAESGMKKIVVSLETRENYERIRCINIYDVVLENVMMVSSDYPEIELEIYMISVGQTKADEFANFKEQFHGKHIIFSQFCATDWLGRIPFEGLTTKAGDYVRRCVCPLFQQYCSIDYEGLMRHCYLDFNSEYVYGDLKESNFDSVWGCDERVAIQERMARGLFDIIEPCRECVFPYTENEADVLASNTSAEDLDRPEMQLLSKIKQVRED